MATPLLPVELDALIEQNITDELDQQNTAQRVREVLLYMVASMGIPVGPGVPGNIDYAALMAEIAKKADRKAVETALNQKEQAFKPFAQSELTTIEYAYSNLALRPLLRALIKAVAAGVGGGAGGPTQDYISTETLGGIRAGDTFTTADPTFVQLLVKYQAPGFASFTVANAGTRTVPVGTPFPAGFKSFAWATSNSGNVAANSIQLWDVTAQAILASNEANDGVLSASTAGFTVGLGLSRRYRLTAQNSNGNFFTADLDIYGETESYLGLSTAQALTGAQLVALGNPQLQGSRGRTASGVTATGGNYLYYAYDARHGDLTSIILDGAAPVLGSFRKLGDVVTTNATGASVTLRVYRSNATNAFTSNTLAFS